MRFIDRSRSDIPARLTSTEAETLRQRMQEYVTDVTGQSSQRRAPIQREFLKHPDLSAALRQLFEGRCAYCESEIDSEGVNGLEPHRPLGLAQGQDGRTDRLYYSWLAYEWDNMMLVCRRCRRHKENRFFVEGERGPVGASVQDLRKSEGAMLLDPSFDDPSEHLEFLPDGRTRPLTSRGGVVIDILALNREELTTARANAFRNIVSELRNDPRSVSARPTGGGSDLSRYALQDTPYPAASTIALLRSARQSGVHDGDLQSLLLALAAMQSSERQRRMDSLLGAPSTPDFMSGAELDQASSPGRRVARIEDMPAARLPIDSVTIRNFKGLRDLNFELSGVPAEDIEAPPCMVILGENATGKSSVLEAIALALLGTQEAAALDGLLREEDISPKGLIHRPNLEAWSEVSSEPLSIDIGYAASPLRTHLAGIGHASHFNGNEAPSKIVLAYGPRRFFSKRAKRRFRAPAYRVRSLFDPMATISNPSDWLLKCPSDLFDAAARALREILMLREEDYFQRHDDRIVVDTAAGRVRLDDMSVGYKSVTAMATDIMRELMGHYDNLEFASATVLIDEIETHLHPRWKMQIMGRLRRAFPRVQFIVTTHDPLCLRGMNDGEVFVLRRRDKDHQIERIEDLPTIKGMRAEQILTSEFFGLGSTDPETDAKLALYHNLAGRVGTLAPEQDRQLARLREELQRNMVIGDTLQEQAVAEALKQAVADSAVTPQRVVLPGRRSILDSALAALRSTPELGPMTSVTTFGQASIAGLSGNVAGQTEQEG